MARSQYFSQLKLSLTAHFSSKNSLDYERLVLKRRELLQLSALAGSASLVGCTSPYKKPDAHAPAQTPNVIVIGAGLAGVHCAYRLKESGVHVVLYEASKRCGGRTYTTEKGFFSDGQVAELGGELIDSDHLVMQHFAQEFDLQLDHLPNALPNGISYGYQYFINNRFIQQSEIIEAFKPIDIAIKKINRELAELEDTGTLEEIIKRRSEIDRNTTLLQFLKDHGASDMLMKVIHYAFVGEFGLEMEHLSVFNLLDLYPCSSNGECVSFSQIVGDVEEFKPFGDSNEIMRFHNGNDGPVKEMVSRLGDSVKIEHVLTRLSRNQNHYIATFITGEGNQVQVIASHVVLALPFSTLRHVQIDQGTLSNDNLEIIRKVAYGTNSKLMGQFASRESWLKKNHDGSLVIDKKSAQGRDMHNLWDTARGQAGPAALWTNFVGGDAGFQLGEGTEDDQWRGMLPALNSVYPDIEKLYNGKAIRMLWPTYPWTMGSYMVVRQGDITMVSNIPHDDNQGSVQFCGEHTSEAFQGFMEGAAETGARAATAILEQLNIRPSENLLKIQTLRLTQVLRKPQMHRSLLEFAQSQSLGMLLEGYA